MGKKDLEDYNKSLLVKDHIPLTSEGRESAEHKLYLQRPNNSNSNDNNYR